MKKEPSVLVTGADGFIGRHLIRALAPARNLLSINAIVRKRPARPLAGVRYHVVRGSLDATGAQGPSNTNKAERTKGRSKYGVKRPKQ